MRRLAALAVTALLAPATARAEPCDGRYPRVTPLPLEAVLEGRAPVQRLWGRANLTAIAGGVSVSFPQGSINPARPDAPLGGAGFLWPLSPGAPARCLTYRVRFEPGFAFARGGKLPGLYGGEAPSGCAPAELMRGFSARLMWREDGAGELYLYAPDRALRCGESIGRGSFRLRPGATHEIVQEVVLNHPARSDGVIRVWFDGVRVIERMGLTLRRDPSVGVEGLMFSTFFGGADPSWASPRTQSVRFTAAAAGDAAAR